VEETLSSTTEPDSKTLPWRQAVAGYQNPDGRRSWWQVANTLVPYFILWYLTYRSLASSYWLTLVLSILAAGFMVRIFIIFHDCGHGSFFKSRKANARLGFITGILTFTPYYKWRHSHAVHHATSSDLDRRGIGDIWMMTVQGYLESSRWQQIAYRVYRNPVAMFVFGPLIVFLVGHRFAGREASKRERYGVYQTNLVLLGIGVLMSVTIGLKAYVLVQLPITLFGATAGVWLFYVQHQYEGVYWERHEKWDYLRAALQGSSFYKLPKLLQWFTGNIGFHHIHHLSPRIPNYYLEKCHNENRMFQEVTPITLSSSLKSLGLRLWDEEHRQLVGFGYVKILRKQQARGVRW
jgi:omega-6 fatty acid desaturase (delta-12 desaturase)